MNRKDYIKLFLGLCGSNTAMMAAFLEYPLHVWANGITHGTLGRIIQRFINETPNFAAFLFISFIAHEKLYWKYFLS